MQPPRAVAGGRRHFVEDDERASVEIGWREPSALPDIDAERRPVTDAERACEVETLIRPRRGRLDDEHRYAGVGRDGEIVSVVGGELIPTRRDRRLEPDDARRRAARNGKRG